MTEPFLQSLAASRSPRDQSLYTDLARIVRTHGLLRRRYGYYWTLITLSILAFGLLWWGVVALGDSWWQLGLAALLGLVVTQFGFLGHEAAHQQIFVSPAWNEWCSRLLAGVFAGLGYSWWREKHNRHHANPNREGSDPDIAPGAIAFTPAAVERHTSGFGAWFVRRQGWLFFPLLTLEGLNLHAASVRSLLEPGRPHRRLELGLVLARLVSYVVVLAVLLPPGKAVAFFVVQMGVFGLCLGGSFAPSHKGMPIVPPTARIDFLRRQVLMSRNVRGGVLLDLAMGGLNRQIEHHLFPSMPRPNLRLVRPLVRDYCTLHGVTYTECSLLASYAIVVDYLNNVGLRARGPFECPVLSTFRT